jgi:sugar lactone lactonase YvrE
MSGNEVFVSDWGGDRINRFSLNGEFLSRWGERGDHGGKFKSPAGIALTPEGNLLVVDTGNRRIQLLTAEGAFLTSWGAHKGEAVLVSPRDVAVDASGDIYVVDEIGGNRILRFRFP